MNNQCIKVQHGAALILLVFMIALIFTTYAINKTTGNGYKALADIKTATAMLEAKQAILGWSVIQNTPGQLPCPEDTSLIGFPTEGQAKSSCTLPAIGRLPWKTLGIGDIRDGNNNKLWYVVSTGFRTSPINSNTPANLAVDGVSSAVAIVLSPGIQLSNQNRSVITSSSPPVLSQYLDLTNNDGDNTFISNGVSNLFNDRLLTITQSELFTLVSKRLLREVRGDSTQGLVKYHTDYGSYPFADINNDGLVDLLQFNGTPTYQGLPLNLSFSSTIKNTLVNNNWFPLINYQLALNTQSVTLTLNGQTMIVSP